MKVLENKCNNPGKIRCPECGSLLEYESSDICYHTESYIICPCCGSYIIIDGDEADQFYYPTPETLQYPKDFIDCSEDDGAVRVSDKEIQKAVHEGLMYLREYKEEFAWTWSTGDTFIVVLRYDQDDSEYQVIVAHGFQEAHAQFTKKDY